MSGRNEIIYRAGAVSEIACNSLVMVAEALALTLSELATKISVPPQDVREVMQILAQQKLVKARELGAGEVVYMITAQGAKEVERRTKRGLAVRL